MNPMDLEQLRSFLTVSELQSFSAAARRHFITQPAVSLRIKMLEEEVGERLIERNGPRIRLTAAGEIFRERCRDAVLAIERGLAEVADLAGMKRGRLEVGAIDAAGVYLLPPLLRRFHALHPGIEVVIRVEPTAGLVEKVARGDLDCAVVTLPLSGADLEVMPIEEETLVLVAPTAARGPVREILEREPLIAYPRGSVTRGLIDRALAERGVVPQITMELAHPEAILQMVAAGLGTAVLPERIVSRSRAGVRRIPSFSVRRWLGLVSRKKETPSPAARAFRALIAERAGR